MAIVFKKVRWKNFLATGNNFIELDLNSHGKTLISGANGSGKSTMIDAVCFALFGKSFRGANKPNLVNSINERDCLVECDLTIGKTDYLIRRGIKPGIFEIYQNGVLFNQDSTNRDYQKYLEQNILRLNYKSFTQIIVLGSSNFTPFMKLTALDRRHVIEDILDIQIFSQMNVLLKERILNLKEDLRNEKNQLVLDTEKITLIESHIQELKDQKDEQVKLKKEKIQDLQDKIAVIQDSNRAKQEKIQDLTESISSLSSMNENLKKMDSIYRQLDRKKKDVEKTKKFFEENDICPSCSQTISTDYKETVLEKTEKKYQDIDNNLIELNELINKNEAKISEMTKKEKEITEASNDVFVGNEKIKSYQDYIQSIQEEITSIVESGMNSEQRDKSEKDLQTAEKSKKTTEEKIEEIKDTQELLGISQDLLKDSGIKSKIISHYLPVMNKLINKYLQSLDFFVQFELDENFKETVKSRHRDEFSYENFSEGQKFRIDISIILAWRDIARLKNSVNTNLLILDEVFDSSLDGDGIDEFMKLLEVLAQDKTNIFVISHRGQSMVDKFDRVLNFDINKNFTQLEELS